MYQNLILPLIEKEVPAGSRNLIFIFISPTFLDYISVITNAKEINMASPYFYGEFIEKGNLLTVFYV
jgi:hypothetical protein